MIEPFDYQLIVTISQLLREHADSVVMGYKVLKNMGSFLTEMTPNKPKIEGNHLLYGDDFFNCGIMQGNTNKFLIEKGLYRPSKYVSYAHELVADHLHYLRGKPKFWPVDHHDKDLRSNTCKNLLILGGPVANQYTKDICGYKNAPSNLENKVPVFQASSPLPYGFYCGDEAGWSCWEGKEVKVRRADEDGVLKEMAKYGIKDRNGNIIEPPVEGNRLAGDMLMIIRIPNTSSAGGVQTIIGGMHGYSLEAFFRDFEINMKELVKVVGSTEFFQVLIPVKLNFDGTTKVDWDGWTNWRPQFIPLRRELF